MNQMKRLKLRIHTEGFCKTIKYILYMSCYCLRETLCCCLLDLIYSGRSLKGNLKTCYKELGANDVYHTKYCVLPLIFRLIKVKKEDVLVDVGCGKGRVINYWLFRRYKNRIIGLELDKRIAAQTARQFAKRKNVTIIPGNAVKHLPANGTIFYFYNPFSKEVVKQFEEQLHEMFKDKPIKIIYYNPKSIEVFQNGNWRIRYYNFEKDFGYTRWGRINKYHDLAIITNKISLNGKTS